jgi:hypothetical protein
VNESIRRGDVRNARTDLEPWRSWKLALLQLAEWDIPYRDDRSGPREAEASKVDPRLEAPYFAPSDYEIGRRSLERLWAYEMATSAPVKQQAEAFIRIADWDFVQQQDARALEQYALAHTALEAAGARTSIDELFSPKIPVVLPAFEPNPLASDATRATGYIDVAFEVSVSCHKVCPLREPGLLEIQPDIPSGENEVESVAYVASGTLARLLELVDSLADGSEETERNALCLPRGLSIRRSRSRRVLTT